MVFKSKMSHTFFEICFKFDTDHCFSSSESCYFFHSSIIFLKSLNR